MDNFNWSLLLSPNLFFQTGQHVTQVLGDEVFQGVIVALAAVQDAAIFLCFWTCQSDNVAKQREQLMRFLVFRCFS